MVNQSKVVIKCQQSMNFTTYKQMNWKMRFKVIRKESMIAIIEIHK